MHFCTSFFILKVGIDDVCCFQNRAPFTFYGIIGQLRLMFGFFWGVGCFLSSFSVSPFFFFFACLSVHYLRFFLTFPFWFIYSVFTAYLWIAFPVATRGLHHICTAGVTFDQFEWNVGTLRTTLDGLNSLLVRSNNLESSRGRKSLYFSVFFSFLAPSFSMF